MFRHGDLSIFNSSIILNYIEETWPTPALLPPAPVERMRACMLEEVIGSHFEANTWGLSEVKHFRRAGGNDAEQLNAFARSEIERWYIWLEAQLGDQPWLNGPEFGWADICVVPFVNGACHFDIEPSSDSRLICT